MHYFQLIAAIPLDLKRKALDSPVPGLLSASSEYFQLKDRTIALTKFLYFIKSEKKITMLFTSQCGSVLGKTVSSVLSMNLGGTQDRGRKHRESLFTDITIYTLTLVCIFSTLFFIHFLRC